MKVSPSYTDGLNSGIGSRDLTSRSLRSASAVDLIPSATSVRASRNKADPTRGPAVSSAQRSGTAAAAPLHRVGHDRPHVPQAGHIAHGIGNSAGRRRIAQRACLPDPPGHPGRPVQADERCVTAFPGGRNQDIDQFR